jgi:hypothetical protein
LQAGFEALLGGSNPSRLSALDEARALMSFGYSYPHQQYQTDHTLTRLSAKLFNLTPAELPPDLKEVRTGSRAW